MLPNGLVCTILFICISLITTAQKASINGRIVDAISNEPLPFVNILVSGTNEGTISDENGNFQLSRLNPGFIRIEASFVGYRKTISSETDCAVFSRRILERLFTLSLFCKRQH